MENKHIRAIVIIVILAAVIIIGGFLIIGRKASAPIPTEPESQVLVSPSGKLSIDNLVQNQVIQTSFTVTGVVQGWFFEGSFPVFMKDSNGNQIGVGLASSSQDWMTANPIPFSVTLPGTNYVGPGTLVFTKDNPSGEPQFDDSYTVPVVFQ